MNLLFIADTNAYAVTVFERGSNAYAKTKFSEALEKVYEFSVQCEQTCVDTSDVVLQGGKIRCFHDTPLNGPYDSFTYSVAPLSQKKSRPEARQEIYDSAFLLSSDIPLLAEAVAAVLLFNLGLCYHKKGIHSGKNLSVTKAMDLYRQSHALLLKLNNNKISNSLQTSSALLVLEAALCYNQAHILQVVFCDTQSSITMMQQLKTVVDAIQANDDNCNDDDCNVHVHLNDLLFFEDGLELFAAVVGPETLSPEN